MKKLTSLSIFFPAFNDAKTIPTLVKKVHTTATKLTKKFEVIIIDDGSTDNTEEVLAKLKKNYSNFKIVKHPQNLGFGAALRSGFKSVKYAWVFYTDGDGQYDPTQLARLVKELDEKTDVVNGYKLERQDPILRKVIGNAYNRVLHLLFAVPVSDIDCDFRLIRKSLLNSIELTSNSGAICLELVLKLNGAGARFKETGVNHYKRPFGSSQFFTLGNILRTLLDVKQLKTGF